MPLALEYGMSEYDFWHREEGLFQIYQKAFYKRTHDMAFTFGQYFDYAIATSLSNVFRDKGQAPQKYLEKPFDVFEELENAQVPKEKKTENAKEIFNKWATIKSK